ncbi:alpha-tectorin-like [Parambassis ranga]|uniref:Alpha-tectorin-like n=1 Tax=Parambassis ranga TaxID=210632 RepID=A0A6P7K207_9TELE|nr:alpha-tectorin-like [Parambassis ranga]XP_028281771.1 alpha-tectorin-like [Parambassis ranga]
MSLVCALSKEILITPPLTGINLMSMATAHTYLLLTVPPGETWMTSLWRSRTRLRMQLISPFVMVSGYSIELSNHWTDRVMVNGLLLRFPSVLSQGKVKLYMTGLSKYVETDFGLIVMYSSRIVTVHMPRIFSGALCGLCGNFNGNPEDDMVPDDDSDFAQAVGHWRTNTERDCVDTPVSRASCNSEDMALYKGKDCCGRLLDSEGAFLSCHKTVDPQDFYDNCVYNLCYGNQANLCEILSGYVALCQEMGATVDEWRTSDFCNLFCPSNSEYQLCPSNTSTCTESPSSLKCKEGCFCKPGIFQWR